VSTRHSAAELCALTKKFGRLSIIDELWKTNKKKFLDDNLPVFKEQKKIKSFRLGIKE